MTILGFGYVAFAILTIGGTILNGAGRTGWALAIALVTLGVAAGANYPLIPRFEPGRDVLIACAAATTGAMVLGALLSGLACKKLFDAFVPLATLARVALAVAVCLGLGYVLPERGKIVTLAEVGFIGIVFLAVLIGTRELGKADVDRFARVLRKKKPA